MAALRQAEKGVPTLSAAQLRDRGAQMLARKLPHDALALLTQVLPSLHRDLALRQATLTWGPGHDLPDPSQAINAGGDTQHMSYATRAQVYVLMEDWEQALYDARKALTLRRDYAKVRAPLLTVACPVRRAGVRGLSGVGSMQGYRIMGDVLMSMQRCAEALYVYQRGIKVRPCPSPPMSYHRPRVASR
jgi:hypothetical protein